MELPIKHKRGTTIPTAGDLVVGEIAINTATGVCYTKTDGGVVVEITSDLGNYVSKDGAVMNVGANIVFSHTANEINIGDGVIEVLSNSHPERVSLFENRIEVSNGPSTTKILPTGILFPDSTFLNTSALANVVYDYDPRIIALNTSFIPQQGYSTVTYPLTYFDGFVGADVTIDITINSPLGYYDNWTVTLDNNLGVGTVITNTAFKAVTLGCQAATMQDAMNILDSGVGAPDAWYVLGSGSPYASSSVLATLVSVAGIPTDLTTDPSMKFLFREELLSELSRLARNANTTDAVLSVNANGTVGFNTNYATLSSLSGYALKSGATFTGKVNLTSVAGVAGLNLGVGGTTTASTVAGDVWLPTGSTLLHYRDATGVQRNLAGQNLTNTFSSPQIVQTANASPALRVTQTGTGHSLVVEDNTNPDTTAFIINNVGAVGIQKDPATWTHISGTALDVTGRAMFIPINANSPSLNVGSTACNSAPTNASAGDVWITNAASPKLAFQTGGVNYYCVVANQFNTFTGQVAISGSSATNPQLLITQTGAGNALVVEDAASPDTNSFVVNAAGNVGIGVSPVAGAWTPAQKLEVVGYATADTAPINDSSTKLATTAYVRSNVDATVSTVWSYTTGLEILNTLRPNNIVRLAGNTNLPPGVTAAPIAIRLDATSNIAIGTQYVFLQTEYDPFEFVPEAGVGLFSHDSKRITGGYQTVCTLIKSGPNEWFLAGNLA
jgi:hypothetical protein